MKKRSTSEADVRVLWCDLRVLPPETLGRLQRCVTRTEAARINRLRSQQTRVRALVSRGGLRLLLASSIGAGPLDVRLRTDRAGRPFLEEPNGPIADFNVTHSGDLLVWAVSDRFRVGIDIERWPQAQLDSLVPLILSSRELSDAGDANDDVLRLLAWRAWVRKEAVLKAVGTGLRQSPSELSLALDSGSPGPLLRRVGVLHEWTLFELHPAAMYLGALAVSAPNPVVECRAIDVVELLRGSSGNNT